MYIDGSWLFKQCGKDGILTEKVYYDTFRLDFGKLVTEIQKELSQYCDGLPQPRNLWYYSSCIVDIPPTDKDGSDLLWLKAVSESKRKTKESAESAGFNVDGFFEVKYKWWMPQSISDGLYQEKMVDTSLVARMVQSCITYPEDFHVLITGDMDMLPAIQLTVPTYLDSVILLTTHPDQWDRNNQQTSFALNNFNFKYDPFYFDDIVGEILQGNHIHRCDKCNLYFKTTKPIPKGKRKFCEEHQNRPARIRTR